MISYVDLISSYPRGWMKHKYNNVQCHNYDIVTKLHLKVALQHFKVIWKIILPNGLADNLKPRHQKVGQVIPGGCVNVCVCVCFTTCYFTDECYRHLILGYLPRHLTTATTVLCLPYYCVQWISSRPATTALEKEKYYMKRFNKNFNFLTTSMKS